MKTYELAVVGAGPAGIAMAVEARYADILPENILILEKGSQHSWAIRQHYAPDKMVLENYKGYDVMPDGALGIGDLTKNDTLDYLSRAIGEYKLTIHYSETVVTVGKNDAVFAIKTSRGIYHARNCAIAIGILEKPNRPDYNLPRSLKKRIHFDVSDEILNDNEFLVVGGGDSAAEKANYLCRHDKKVTLSYRRDKFERLSDISRGILEKLEGRIEILRASNIIGVENKGGRPVVRFAEQEYGTRAFDDIVYCLGGTTPTSFLRAAGISFDGEMPLIMDSYETNVPGLFLIGDLSAGIKGGSVNWAFNSSHAAMRKICEKYIMKFKSREMPRLPK